MTRRGVLSLPDLPAQIAAAARSAAARKTVAMAIAPSASADDFEVYCATIVAKHDAELVESTAALAKRSAERRAATSELLRGCFGRAGVSGVSSWSPSYSIVAG